jgi:soluble lytic murein transglycosylase-like protein
VVWLAAIAVFSSTTPAAADDTIARRLGALRMLASPGATRAPAAERLDPAELEAGCANSVWWRATEYGIRSRMDAAIRDASIRHVVDANLIRSVIDQESDFNVHAVSHKGAMGLMQLMPGTARVLGVRCAFDPRENVLGGTRYLRMMRDRLGSWSRAVAAYHCGPGCVESGRIPTVTRLYAQRVLRGWRPRRYQSVRFDRPGAPVAPKRHR